jgi:hypothetical protein
MNSSFLQMRSVAAMGVLLALLIGCGSKTEAPADTSPSPAAADD